MPSILSKEETDEIRRRLEESPTWTIDISHEQLRLMLNTIDFLRGPLDFSSDGVREWVLFLVMREMQSHDNEYGYPRKLPDGEKIKILAEETGEVARAMQDGDRNHLVTEYVQVAAVAIQHAVIVEQEGEDYAP